MAETAILPPALGSDSAGTITTQNLVPAGVATNNSSISLPTGGRNTLVVQVSGTYTGALSLQGTVDGTTWYTLGGSALLLNIGTAVPAATIASAATGIWQAGITGLSNVRIVALAAVTGTATVTLRAADGNALVALDSALPSGTNALGGVTATPVTGTAFTLVTAATTNPTVLKATTGSLYELLITNTSAAAIYVKLYNKATAPTVGTDIPLASIQVPANSEKAFDFGVIGKRFAAGIALAVTAGQASTDTAAVLTGSLLSGTYL